MKEKDEGDWIIQQNWKVGAHLLNLRGKTVEDFKENAEKIKEDIEFFHKLFTLFDPQQQNLPIGDVRATPPPETQTSPVAAAPQAAQAPEVGPLAVTKVADDKVTAGPNAKFPGRVYPKWIVEFGNGALVAETLTPLIADAAKNLLGKNAYARVEKGRYGYKLLNIRTAA